MYRGPSRGPCVGTIYTHPSRVGGIQALFSPIWYQSPSSLLPPAGAAAAAGTMAGRSPPLPSLSSFPLLSSFPSPVLGAVSPTPVPCAASGVAWMAAPPLPPPLGARCSRPRGRPCLLLPGRALAPLLAWASLRRSPLRLAHYLRRRRCLGALPPGRCRHPGAGPLLLRRRRPGALPRPLRCCSPGRHPLPCPVPSTGPPLPTQM